MKVAWQFAARNLFTKSRPVGHGLSWSSDRFAIQVEDGSFRPNHTVPYGTGSVSCIPLAVNCQATITCSLRDKKFSPVFRCRSGS
jgi:hypothetical protein